MYAQNNGFYTGYQNPYMMQGNGAMPDVLNQMKMQYQQPQVVTPKPTSDMLWVLNENEAVSFPVAMNNSVVLWDKNKPTIYVKSVNAQGVPSIRILDFVERADVQENAPKTHECGCLGKFATKEQFDDLTAKYEQLEAKYSEMLQKRTKTTKKEDDE